MDSKRGLPTLIIGGFLGCAACYVFGGLNKQENVHDASEADSKQGKPVRVLTTMVADALHIGHITHIMKTRKFTEEKANTKNVCVVIGIHSNKTVESYKRTPLYNMEERINHINECPDVDEVLSHAPLDLTLEYLQKHKIDYVAGNLMDGDSEAAKRYNSQYQIILDMDRFINVPRMEGISTTDIINRAVAGADTKSEDSSASSSKDKNDAEKAA